MYLFQSAKQRAPPKQRTAHQPSAASSTGMTAADVPGCDEGSTLSTAHVQSEHAYHVTVSPRKLKRQLHSALDQNEVLRKKVKTEQTKNSKLKKRIHSLKSVVSTLRDKNLVTTHCAELLESTFSGVSKDVMKRILKQKRHTDPGQYTAELRSFAMTLNFYSAKAYRFVRKSFDLGLPHPAVIRKWYGAINGDPGFTDEVFRALKAKVLAAARDKQQVVCGLLMDEMSIKKHVEWDGKRFRGFVDLGTAVDDDSVATAKDAFVFMVVSLNGAWKVPCGYFLIDSLTGQEKANLVSTCLQKLNDSGIKIKTLTCDGPSAHLTMLKALGADLDPSNLIPSFTHPCDHDFRVCVFLDACHMLKLVRNTIADQKVLIAADGTEIKWGYIEELHALQQQEGLRLGNRLKSAHINWQRQKMKVNLAAQSLSSSVADALVFCRLELKLSAFMGCEATVDFIVLFDRLFDILNSRNPLAKGYKAPLRATNFSYVDTFLTVAEQYIMSLKDRNGVSILKSRRKTGFLGFLICIKSVRMLMTDLLMPDPAPMKYFLTYKVSQDHLELFFGAVRSAGGFNNNPIASQFAASYRRLLMRNQIEGGRGNCAAQDDTQILDRIEEHTRHTDIDNVRRYGFETQEQIPTETDYMEVPDVLVESLSEYKEAAISYIAGYVVRMVTKRIVCPVCTDALFETEKDVLTGSAQMSLVHFKNRGGLVLPSPSVLCVCYETEKCVQRMLKESGGSLPKGDGLVGAITMSVLDHCSRKQAFHSLESHMYDSTPTTNHLLSLIKCCAECFIKIRMHHLGKMYSEQISGAKIRKQFSKLILFKHQ